jgi:hypothetical protein
MPGADGGELVICTDKRNGKRRTIAHAYKREDAILLASAPQLLKALQDMRGEIDSIQGYWTEGLDNFAMQADQAIEHATGVPKSVGSPASV